MENILLIGLSFVFVLVLLQYRRTSKQNIKIESLEELCNVVSDQVDDIDISLDDLADEVFAIKTPKSRKKGV